MAGRDWNVRDVTMRLEDADGLGMTIGPSDGVIQFSALNAENATRVRVLDRGVFDGEVITEDLEQTFGVTVRALRQVPTHSILNRVRDFIMHEGSFLNAVSVNDDGLWAFKAIFTYTANGTTYTETWPYVRAEIAASHAFPSNTMALTFTANGAPTLA